MSETVQGYVLVPEAEHARNLAVVRAARAEWEADGACAAVFAARYGDPVGDFRPSVDAEWQAATARQRAAYEALHAAVAARPPAAESEVAALADQAAAAAARPIGDTDAWARRLAADLAEGQD